MADDCDEDLFPRPPSDMDHPAPWTVEGGSVRWILDELKLSSLYGQTFDEYGVVSARQLTLQGRAALRPFCIDALVVQGSDKISDRRHVALVGGLVQLRVRGHSAPSPRRARGCATIGGWASDRAQSSPPWSCVRQVCAEFGEKHLHLGDF